MINLIPPQAKKNVLKEYWVRVISVWMFMLGTGFLVIASLFLPTYVILQNERSALEQQVKENAVVTATYDTSATALAMAMKQADLLLAGGGGIPFMSHHTSIKNLASSGIRIDSLSYERTATTTLISLTGIASNRQALADFRDDLEVDPFFSDVLLPISSLIKDKNLEFSMTLVGLSIQATP